MFISLIDQCPLFLLLILHSSSPVFLPLSLSSSKVRATSGKATSIYSFIHNYTYMGMSVCGYMYVCADAPKGQKRALDTLGLELQVCHLM